MFGLDGFGVPLGFGLTVLSALVCVAYGVINWNQGRIGEQELQQRESWSREDQALEENI